MNICGCDAKGQEEMLIPGCCRYYGDEIRSNLQLSLIVVIVYWWLDTDLKSLGDYSSLLCERDNFD